MKSVCIDESATSVSDLVKQAKKEPLLLRDRKGWTFVLLEMDDADAEAWSLGGSAALQQLVERSRARARREG